MKQRAKDIAIRALASKPLAALMSPLLKNRASIFMLHRFRVPEAGLYGLHEPTLLRACLEELRRARVPVLSLDELVDQAIAGEPAPAGPVVFTMDDGFWDQAEIGAEIFLEYDIPVTIFLITGLQDGNLWPWDDRLACIYETTRLEKLNIEIAGTRLQQRIRPDRESRRRAMRETRELFKRLRHNEVERQLASLAQLAGVVVPAEAPAHHRAMGWETARRLEQRGVQFAPHTVSHGILSRMEDVTARREITDAWSRLQAQLAAPVNIYCWPTGRDTDFSPREITIVREAGFKAAVATENDYATLTPGRDGNGLFALRRFGFPATVNEFIKNRSWVGRR